MDIEMKLFLSLKDLFEYLQATPTSRSINEGQAVLNANHVITCGIIEQTEAHVAIFALCLQTSALTASPHEVRGSFKITETDACVQEFLCSCKGGNSGRCKHIAAVLLFCNRNNILALPLLSSTDLTCYWTKNTATESYGPAPLLEQTCLSTKVLPPVKHLSEGESKEIVDLFANLLTESALGRHRTGRREEIVEPEVSLVEINQNLQRVIENCATYNLLDQLQPPSFQHDCCREFYQRLTNINIVDVAAVSKSDNAVWKMERQFRITGSRCYAIYTYHLNAWESKAQTYFKPTPFTNKYTEHGKAHEGAARAAYAKSNNYTVVEAGLIVSQKQPWLGYTPDGIVFKDVPIKLLEIKCPYVGKETSAINFINTCSYLTIKDDRLVVKKKHMYYAQMQLGMAILNLPECDFVLYSSHSKNFINIIVKYDEPYARALLLKLQHNYFVNMLHVACLNKIKIK